MFVDGQGAEHQSAAAKPIPKFPKMARKFVERVREDLSGNEVRALAANQVASPVLQVMCYLLQLK